MRKLQQVAQNGFLGFNIFMKIFPKITDDSGKLFLIGGVVRDEILGRESFDVDITYVGNAIKDCADMGEVIRTNPDFGTIRVKINGAEVDIASTRSEIYPKAGHLPVVDKIGCSLKDDVLRRDFTINSLAKSIKTGEIIDYTGGLDDLKNGILRVLHDKSFIDDPTRILRLLKFSLRFGFHSDTHTRQLMENYLNNVNYDMCYARIKKELKETFSLNTAQGFDRFFDEKIYKLLTPEEQTKPEINPHKIIEFMQSKGIVFNNLWLAYVGVITDLERLDFTREEKKILEDFNRLKSVKLATNLEIYKNFSRLLPETLVLLAVFGGKNTVEHYINDLKNIKLEITGDDVLSLGVKPSAQISVLLDRVLEYKLQQPNINKNAEIEILKKMIFKT